LFALRAISTLRRPVTRRGEIPPGPLGGAAGNSGTGQLTGDYLECWAAEQIFSASAASGHPDRRAYGVGLRVDESTPWLGDAGCGELELARKARIRRNRLGEGERDRTRFGSIVLSPACTEIGLARFWHY
jgi:hypothetical protein